MLQERLQCESRGKILGMVLRHVLVTIMLHIEGCKTPNRDILS